MNARSGLEDLQSQIDSQILVLDETASFLATMLSDEIRDQKNRKNGLVVAGLLENYYTAAETVLFRVVQEFGNNLRPDHWHADLLERLSRELPETRPRVLGDESYRGLDELRRFRHFKRYYYRLDYDWDKLDFLTKKLRELHPVLIHELRAFKQFLIALSSTDEP